MDSNRSTNSGLSEGRNAPIGTILLPDAKFWAAYAKWKTVVDAWDVHEDTRDMDFDRYNAEVYEAFSAMWLTPIHSAYALATKVASCNFASVDLPEPAGNTLTMLEWDLGRLVMRELAPDQANLMVARKWDAALNRYRRAHDAVYIQADANIDEGQRELLMEPLIEAEQEAFDELRELSPADASGLADKIQVFAAKFEDFPMAQEDFAILIRDAQSLAGKARQ